MIRILRLVPLLLLAAACSQGMRSTDGSVGLSEMGAAGRGGVPADRMVIQQANLSMSAPVLEPVARAADSLTVALGGYVADAQLREDRSLRMTLRVPADRLTMVLDHLSTLGRVKQRTVSRNDVTEQMTDVEARLANLRAVRDRLRQHLAAAERMEDVLAIERELARVQGEIDSLEAHLRGLQGRVQLAQVELEVERPPVLGPLGVLFVGIYRVIEKLFVVR